MSNVDLNPQEEFEIDESFQMHCQLNGMENPSHILFDPIEIMKQSESDSDPIALVMKCKPSTSSLKFSKSRRSLKTRSSKVVKFNLQGKA